MKELERGSVSNPDENQMVGHYWLRYPQIAPSLEIQKKIPKYLNDSNIFTFRAGDIISLCPPLNINKDEIDFLVEGLASTIHKIEKET